MRQQRRHVYAEDMTDERMNAALEIGEEALKEFSSDPNDGAFSTVSILSL